MVERKNRRKQIFNAIGFVGKNEKKKQNCTIRLVFFNTIYGKQMVGLRCCWFFSSFSVVYIVYVTLILVYWRSIAIYCDGWKSICFFQTDIDDALKKAHNLQTKKKDEKRNVVKIQQKKKMKLGKRWVFLFCTRMRMIAKHRVCATANLMRFAIFMATLKHRLNI